MAPQMVGSTVEDIVADGLAAELPVRHRGCQDAMAKTVVAESITQSPPLPLQPYRATEIVLHRISGGVAALQLTESIPPAAAPHAAV